MVESLFRFSNPVPNFFHFVDPGQSVIVSKEQARLTAAECSRQGIAIEQSECLVFALEPVTTNIQQVVMIKLTRALPIEEATGLLFANKARKQHSIFGDNVTMIFTNGPRTKNLFRSGINTNLLRKEQVSKPKSIQCFIYDKKLDIVYKGYAVTMIPQSGTYIIGDDDPDAPITDIDDSEE